MIKSQAETPRSYIVLTPQGEKRRNRIHLREAGISTNAVPKAPNVEKVKYVLLTPNKSPSVQSVCVNQMREKYLSQQWKVCQKQIAKCVKAKGKVSA